MLCPNCQRDNQPGARFCIFCGLPLQKPRVESTQAGNQAIRNEIDKLRRVVAQVNKRLDDLERMQSEGAAEPIPQPEPVLPPVPEAVPAPAVSAPPPEVAPARVKEREWEQILGGNWLARIGVLALIIGIGFFLKFAFDNDWIGPTGRIILGIIAGLVLLGLGYYWRRRYPGLTRVLSGGGIAVLYLSVFGAFAIYDLIGLYVSVFFLLLISVASAALALYYDSMSLAIIGIIGAFFAPFILGAFRERGIGAIGTDTAIQLSIYIIIVDLGALVLSTFRNWRWFTLLSLFFSLITFGFWYGEFHRIGVAVSEIFITILFLIFVGATFLYHIIWRRIPRSFDYTLMVINAAAYFGISLGIMWGDFRVWMGGFIILLAIFYGLLSYLALKRSVENTRISLFALGIALVFLTVAIPVQLGDKAWTTVVWAVELVLLVWLSFSLKITFLCNYSYAIFAAMTVRLLFFDTTINLRNFQPVLNERFLAFIFGIAATYLAGYMFRRYRQILSKWSIPASIYFIAANFFSIWILSFEVWNYFGHAMITSLPPAIRGLRNAQNLSLTALWAIYAVIGLVVGIVKRWRYVRLGALGLFVVPIVKVFVYDVFKLEMAYRIGAFVGLGILLLVSAFLYQRYSKYIKGVFIEK